MSSSSFPGSHTPGVLLFPSLLEESYLCALGQEMVPFCTSVSSPGMGTVLVVAPETHYSDRIKRDLVPLGAGVQSRVSKWWVSE